jgi:topoisomerase-4 subunit A
MSKFSFITEHQESELELVSTDWRPQVELIFQKEKGKDRQTEIINLEDFITVKGEKALGNKLTSKKIKEINLLTPLPYTELLEEIKLKVLPEEVEKKVIEVKTKIELNITNHSSAKIKDENGDDKSSEGQITLEL